MLKKSITFQDLDGNSITEDFYFNLSKAELGEMEMSEAGGLKAKLERIIANAQTDPGSLIKEFKNIILAAYGVRSDDNRRFFKSEELSAAFAQTDAYSELFTQLVTNPDEAAKFVNAIVPSDLSDVPAGNTATLPTVKPTEDVELPQVAAISAEDVAGSIQAAKDAGVSVTDMRTPQVAELSDEQLQSMTRDELLEYMQRRNDA